MGKILSGGTYVCMYVSTHTNEGKKDLQSNFIPAKQAVTIIILSVTALRPQVYNESGLNMRLFSKD